MARQLREFEGSWRFSRRVENATGPDAVMEGTARFTPDGAGLTLHESGEMRLDGQGAFQAERRYLWRAGPGRIVVLFDDGRPFHDFDPDEVAPRAEHACDPDHYRVAYDFARWPDWQAVWQVRGPRKDYVMRTLYRRS
ncbi:DUF6314 family protein [Pseudooceanicola sp. LIPI14-2-Ac024]|uniref:DUF6314 family protein n=1 Tax=Pseudooceanicola sp. LIPI14-2-Ac024 TaxID=3344875 RepID=UPI0035D12DF7